MRKHSFSDGLLSFSGGLTYHLRALRYQNSLWAPFRSDLKDWLSQWNPPEKKLTILGSSAGHCFPFEILNRFDSITINDPDRIATLLFIKRASRFIARDRIHFSKEDLLSPNAKGTFDWSLSEKGLFNLRDSALLFTNCLGQIPFLSPLPEDEENSRNTSGFSIWRKELEKHLSKRTTSWCTYHDVYSSDRAPRTSKSIHARETFQSDGKSDLITLQDHFMDGFMPAHSRHRMSWQLLPNRWHLIEGLYYSAPTAGAPESSPAAGK